MPTPHKHAALIKQWADGATIEVLRESQGWTLTTNPQWLTIEQYRVKPEPTILHGFALYNEHLGTFQFKENNNRFFAGKPAILTFLPDAQHLVV